MVADHAATQASGQASDILVTGARDRDLSIAVTEIDAGTDAATLDRANTVTAESALRYLPNLQVRQRFIGDTGSGVAVRGTNGFQTARILVTLDGMPISNLLGNTYIYAPLWGLIASGEIERVDAMYGPFSARQGGNTLGAGIFIRTRLPDKLEGMVDVTYGHQAFAAQRTDDRLGTWRTQAQLGDRRGQVAWSLYYDHLASRGQPLYFAITPVSSGAQTLSGRSVTGFLSDRDATGIDRYILGSSGETRTVSDLAKAKIAWDAGGSTRLLVTAAYRNLHYTSLSPETYLRDGSGTPVLTGRVDIRSRAYDLSTLLGFRQQDVRLRDLILGTTLSSALSETLRSEVSASVYTVLDGETRQAYPAGNVAQVVPTDRQGWANAAARFAWTPARSPVLGEEIGFGTDYARYWTRTSTFGSDDWRRGLRTRFAEQSGGKTETLGAYVDDRWTLAPRLSLMAGLRYDYWRAFDGTRQLPAIGIAYPTRDADGWSPKGSLRWTPDDAWTVELQAAHAYRFPTVTELFQSATTGGVLVQSDPNLRPERGTSIDLGTSRAWTVAGGSLRLGSHLYQDRVRDTLFSQRNAFTGASYYQNIGLVRTRGGELTANGRALFTGLLDFDASIARQWSEIRANTNLPASIGNEMPRVPRWRWSALATLHPTDEMDATLGIRHEGRQFNDILNSDGRRGGFGFADPYSFVETKLAYRIMPALQASIGVDNLFDQVRYLYHPYPGRTIFLAVKWHPA